MAETRTRKGSQVSHKKEVHPQGAHQQQTTKFVALDILPDFDDNVRGVVVVVAMFLLCFISACIDAGVLI